MKSLSLSAIFNPIYVLIAGTIGLSIIARLFLWHYPASQDITGFYGMSKKLMDAIWFEPTVKNAVRTMLMASLL